MLTRSLPGSRWGEVRVLARTGSTNADLAALARAGAPAGTVITTDHQDAGRGRLDRRFVMPARSGIAVSSLLRPTVPLPRWSWLPLVAGLAVADLANEAGVRGAGIKWPNDVLVADRKICGILLERVEPDPGIGLPAAAVIGIGVNVSLTEQERPTPTATSLLREGAHLLDRTSLVVSLLAHLDRWLTVWEDERPEAARELKGRFIERCSTIGQQVTIAMPDGTRVQGPAETVDDSGRLVVNGQPFSAGDVTHVRPTA